MKSLSKILSANTLALCFLCVLMLSFRTANAQRFILGDKFKDNDKNWQNTSGKLNPLPVMKSMVIGGRCKLMVVMRIIDLARLKGFCMLGLEHRR